MKLKARNWFADRLATEGCPDLLAIEADTSINKSVGTTIAPPKSLNALIHSAVGA